MDTIFSFLITSIIVILALVASNIFLFLRFYNTNKKIDLLLEKGNIKDLKDIFLKQIKRNEEQDETIKEIFSELKNLNCISEKTIQKIGTIRFNPFSNLGGNQSFSIALLDKKNNGFIISSLFIKEGSRVYAKTIKSGKSDYTLSEEEQEALKRAMDSK